MGKKQTALFNQLLAQINKMNDPKNNEAQNFLTQDAIAGAEYLKKGDYSTMPKGQFFNFQMPTEQSKAYKELTNVGAEGTFALGDDGGKSYGAARAFQADKFARDASLNYQNNIAGAAGNIRSALGQAAGAKGQTDAAVIGSLQNLYQSMPPGFSWGGLAQSAIGAGAQIATKLI